MTILDNQEVIADILNGIAKDLGATTFDKFKDGVKFGADELNEITAALVTPGVLGIESDSCRVTIADGKISVATGTIVFVSGAKMKISENQMLEMVPNAKTYIVAVNDIINNRMLLYNSAELPDEDDYVLLAEISENGELIDKRAWSTAKVVGMGGPVYEHIQVEVAAVMKPDHTYTLSKVVNLTRSGYHAMSIRSGFRNDYRITGISLDGAGMQAGLSSIHSSGLEFRIVYDGKSTVSIYTKLGDLYYNDSGNTVIVDSTLELYFF